MLYMVVLLECNHRFERRVSSGTVTGQIAESIETGGRIDPNQLFIGAMCAITRVPCMLLTKNHANCRIALEHASSVSTETPPPSVPTVC